MKIKQSKKYIIIFVITIALNISLYAVFIEMDTEANVSNICSWLASMLFAFPLYKIFIIKDNNYRPSKLWKDFGKFFFDIMFLGIISLAFFYEFYSRGINQPIFGIDGFSTKIIVVVMEIAFNCLNSIEVELPKNRKTK